MNKPYLVTESVKRVPWSYLPRQFSGPDTDEILDRLRAFVATGAFTLGAPVREFEERFAALIGTRHAIGVNSGTDAIKLALRAIGVSGGEVITTANTFIATAGAIVEAGARPVFVDCTDNFCMDASQVENAIVPNRTKAIVPVHFAGQMTDMPKLKWLANKYAVPIVEDACQCILGSINGKKAGTWGQAGAFSLHPLKNLNVWGDGGVIVTDSNAINTRLRRLRNHGLKDRDTFIEFGYNSRLDSVQAVVGNWMIEQAKAITSVRIVNAAYLDQQLSLIPQIKLPTRYPVGRRLVYHLYIVFAERRDELMAHCLRAGVEVKIHYPVPLYRQPALAHLGYMEGDFPVADRHAATMLSLPAHEHLTREELDYMVETIRDFYHV